MKESKEMLRDAKLDARRTSGVAPRIRSVPCHPSNHGIAGDENAKKSHTPLVRF